MSKEVREYFAIYRNTIDASRKIKDPVERLSFLDAVFDACLDGDFEPELEGSAEFIFDFFKEFYVKNYNQWKRGSLGGRNKNAENQNETTLEPLANHLQTTLEPLANQDETLIKNRNKIETEVEIESEIKKKKEKENPSPYNPPYPTLAEVEEYVFRFNLAVDARRFYSKMSGDGWTIDGEPIRDWRKLCQAWSRKQRESEEPDMSDRVLDDGTVIRNGKRYYTHPVSKHVIELPNNAPRRPDPALMYYFDEMDWKLPIQR